VDEINNNTDCDACTDLINIVFNTVTASRHVIVLVLAAA